MALRRRKTPRKRPAGRQRLSRFFAISLLAHLLLALAGLLYRPSLSVIPPFTEVELVSGESDGDSPAAREEGPPERTAASGRAARDPQAERTAGQPSSRSEQQAATPSRRGRRRTPPARPSSGDDDGSAPAQGLSDRCLLGMRDCAAAGEAAPAAPSSGAKAQPDRLASFRVRRGEAAPVGTRPAVLSRLEHDGVQAVAYEDGGRLLRNSGGRTSAPGRGTIGLLTLASSRIGESNGRTACDPYKGFRPDGPRHLVLLVDTSGSIVATKQVPAVIVCAAGAALAALSRGYPVTVANFSSQTVFYRTSRNTEVIYTAISRVQGESTILPRLSLLPLDRGDSRDYVLISDAAIHNLKDVLPDYRRALQREPDSRALLFALGDGQQKEVAALERTGFTADRVEAPGRDFQRFVARSLEGVLPPLRELPSLRRAGKPASKPKNPGADQSTGLPPPTY